MLPNFKQVARADQHIIGTALSAKKCIYNMKYLRGALSITRHPTHPKTTTCLPYCLLVGGIRLFSHDQPDWKTSTPEFYQRMLWSTRILSNFFSAYTQCRCCLYRREKMLRGVRPCKIWLKKLPFSPGL